MNQGNKILLDDALELTKRLRKNLDFTYNILKLLSTDYSSLEFADKFLNCIKEWLDCSGIGIRVLNRYGYIPYESYIGHSKHFWESENWVSLHKDDCICIRVITGARIPGDDFTMTPGGSFYCNNTFHYVHSISEEQFKMFRGYCFKAGYKSIAVIPIVSNKQNIGVIHITDPREDKFLREFIELLEIVAPVVGEVITTSDREVNMQENSILSTVINNLFKSINHKLIKYSKESSSPLTANTAAKDEYLKVRKSGLMAKYSFREIISRSDVMLRLLEDAKIISRTEQPVLINGESGCGKELLANAIHNESRRVKGPFVALNCASFSKSLIESELFGYSEGAFTGASKGGKKGKIELANNGTLFLDEVGDLPLNTQAMLLRTIEEKEVLKIGDESITRVDFRLICATNKNLKELCERGQFRHDLYYRLAGCLLQIPALRHRKEDIELLANHILLEVIKREGLTKTFSSDTLRILQKYQWPGNIRELRNLVESSFILSRGDVIDIETVENLLEINNFVSDKLNAEISKKERFFEVLKDMNGKVSTAARKLNLSRATAYRWLKDKNNN